MTIIFVALYLIIIGLKKGINSFINWLTTVSTGLDAVIIVALITGAVSIIGVIISSIISKTIEYKHKRREYLTQKREKSYNEFVDMVYKLQKNGKNGFKYTQEDMMNDLLAFSSQITLWGSSKIVNKWVEFRENGANPQSASNNLFLLEEIMNEMRRDLGLKKVKKGTY